MSSPRYPTDSRAIPTRRASDFQDGGYSSTPGGTLYSTTPGGTKIAYDRSYLMNLRNSPISKTPPKWDNIPQCLQKGNPNRTASNNNDTHTRNNLNSRKIEDDGELFPMDI